MNPLSLTFALVFFCAGFVGTLIGGRYVNEHVDGEVSRFLGYVLLLIWMGVTLAFTGKLLLFTA